MCNYAAAKKMEVIGCLVPELQSEKYRGRGMQLFEKTQCFMLLSVSVYTCTIVLRKIETCLVKSSLKVAKGS